MMGDKKNRGGLIHFALPATVGRMHRQHGWTTAVPDTAIRRVLALSNAG
jgi:3-dehydroquinate synthetase